MTEREELIKRLQSMFPEQDGFVVADGSFKPIDYGTVKQIIVALTARAADQVNAEGQK